MRKENFQQEPGEEICLPELQQQGILQAKSADNKNQGRVIMELTKETQDKIQEMSLTEHNLQNLSLQKQAFQMELNEVSSAIEETEKSKDDAYKIVGQVMIRADKKELLEELKEKQQVLNLRVKSIEKQEALLIDRLGRLKKEVEEMIKTRKK